MYHFVTMHISLGIKLVKGGRITYKTTFYLFDFINRVPNVDRYIIKINTADRLKCIILSY